MSRQEVVLEGFHVCKHAIRNGAEITDLVTPDKQALKEMTIILADDIQQYLDEHVREVDIQEFYGYTDIQIRTPLAGKALVPEFDTQAVDKTQPLVVLEQPRDLDNIGAVVRVAAGLGVAAVCTTGEHDAWHKNSVRSSQGAHFAVPVGVWSEELASNRAVYVFDESGKDISQQNIPHNALLVFGSERRGVGHKWLSRADVIVRIPQSDTISSYNLATSVAMGLYHAKHCKKQELGT